MLNSGDEVIIFTPYWVSYYEIVKLADGVPVCLDSTVENNYKPNAEDLRKCITAKSKMLIFSSPCNPTGTVFHEKICKNMLKY